MIKTNEATFIVTDVETTGSHTSKNRMTEIACVTLRGGEIVSQYSSLMNPHQAIPPYVAKMTGISQAMVSVAPEEYDILDTVKSLFPKKNGVFAAHNVAFDYGFVSAFFNRGFVHFDYPQLCTLKLARKLLPRDIKKNVGDLSAYFGIRMKNRHRALIDARATAQFLTELLYIAEHEHGITLLSELLQFQNKPVYNYKVSKEVQTKIEKQLKDIPYTPGIFKFADSKGKLLYWDYSYNLNSKIHSFFDTPYITSRTILEMTNKISTVSWETTDSELSALIIRDKLRNQSNTTNGSRILALFDFDDKTEESEFSGLNNFIYLQAQNSSEKVVDLYFINQGKLAKQFTLGKRAPLENLKSKIKDTYKNIANQKIDYSELRTINKWIEMQNETGLVIETNDKDIAQITEEIHKAIEFAFELIAPASKNDFYY